MYKFCASIHKFCNLLHNLRSCAPISYILQFRYIESLARVAEFMVPPYIYAFVEETLFLYIVVCKSYNMMIKDG